VGVKAGFGVRVYHSYQFLQTEKTVHGDMGMEKTPPDKQFPFETGMIPALPTPMACSNITSTVLAVRVIPSNNFVVAYHDGAGSIWLCYLGNVKDWNNFGAFALAGPASKLAGAPTLPYDFGFGRGLAMTVDKSGTVEIFAQRGSELFVLQQEMWNKGFWRENHLTACWPNTGPNGPTRLLFRVNSAILGPDGIARIFVTTSNFTLHVLRQLAPGQW
jgi:hypothetical protein